MKYLIVLNYNLPLHWLIFSTHAKGKGDTILLYKYKDAKRYFLLFIHLFICPVAVTPPPYMVYTGFVHNDISVMLKTSKSSLH